MRRNKNNNKKQIKTKTKQHQQQTTTKTRENKKRKKETATTKQKYEQSLGNSKKKIKKNCSETKQCPVDRLASGLNTSEREMECGDSGGWGEGKMV